ncbi:N(4)-acetylcytidine aminohydrolase [Marinomonas sp. RSW2]|uniref:N(4)-acetylcytidine amidohydrolase n=1 Tax=Marinomonas maritima TaxID=2940935 RepID=A0ABT5WBK6_9GAMM|nr:N(4)-acetylcytidine aminohydrolase [Marinomonas maritima]MDE8602203.1 N(4)-acetylcytidine aminohydrolase [Marinomonas maritima]
MSLSKITFFERFEADILSGKKTITIRDEAEKDYAPNSVVQVSTYENDRWFCALKIQSVDAIAFSQLSEFHAQQENMTLPELKNVIQEIYPDVERLYVISYELIG